MHVDSEAKVERSAPEVHSRGRSYPDVDSEDMSAVGGLDGRQIFFLLIGSAVFACLVFAIGVFVGRRIERNSAAQAAQQSASDPLAILDEIANAEESLTFHRALSPAAPALAPRPNRPPNQQNSAVGGENPSRPPTSPSASPPPAH